MIVGRTPDDTWSDVTLLCRGSSYHTAVVYDAMKRS